MKNACIPPVVVVVLVGAVDSVGSLNTCGLAFGLAGFTLTLFGSDSSDSTFIRWNVIADVSGIGNVIGADIL